MTVTEIGRPATGEDAAEEARLRRELAAVYRLIAHFRMTDLIYNHISVRLPGTQVDALAGGGPLVIPSPEVCERTARQSEGSPGTDDDYSNDAAPNLAWDAMLRLVERLYPDYKD